MSTTLEVPSDNKATLFGFAETVGLVPLEGETEALTLTSPEKPEMLVSVIGLVSPDPRVRLIDSCPVCS